MIENQNILNAYNKMKRYTEQMKNNHWMLGYRSHHPALDNFTSWIIPWKVYTIAAYSNVGKSRFSYGYVNHFLKMGKKVCFFSLEVDKGLLLQHLIGNMYKVWAEHIKEDTYNLEDFKNLYIFDDIYTMSWIEQLIADFKPDICVIDFVQNIQVEWMNWYEGMAHAARKIQQIAINSNTTIICLSQLSNSVAKEISWGKMDFIALKWAWEFVASSDVIFLLRIIDWQIWLTVAKTKFARKPDWELFFNADFGTSTFKLIQDPFINKEAF